MMSLAPALAHKKEVEGGGKKGKTKGRRKKEQDSWISIVSGRL